MSPSSPYEGNKSDNMSAAVAERSVSVASNAVTNPAKHPESASSAQIISGYFITEKSYKEMVIARVNTFLCCILALLVTTCLVSYYFVALGEIELNQIRKNTVALNYDNEDMQNKLDNLQSFYNVDRAVAKANVLQRAKKVVELSAVSLPGINFDEDRSELGLRWFMGY
jgi:hypothetical protein